MAFFRSGRSMVSHLTGPRSSVRSQVTAVTVDRPGRGVTVPTMGFNPFRDHEKDITDIVVMVVALVAILAVLAWAIFSG